MLITSPSYMAISDIMKPDPLSINHLDDKEAAADMIQKYEFLSLPVVDNTEKLIGLVTWDDAVEVIEDKLTDEYFTSSGVSSKTLKPANCSVVIQ
ncbi:MAG: CBS domain-containing protein [Vampirovibrionales bacterium]